MFDFVFFRHARFDFGQGNMQAGEEAEFGVRRCQVVDEAQAILLRNIRSQDTGFLAYFATYGPERVGLPIACAIAPAFKEAADDVVASNIHVYALAFIEQDIAVAGLHNGTDGERVAQFLPLSPTVELRHARSDILFVAAISQRHT